MKTFSILSIALMLTLAVPATTLSYGQVEPSIIHVDKFYDANLDGVRGDPLDEPGIEGWLVEVSQFSQGVVVTDSSTTGLTTAWIEVSSGTNVVAEAQEENWAPTNHIPTVIPFFASDNAIIVSSSTTLTVSEGEQAIVEFGNVCLADGDGMTKGFWGNKNGARVITDSNTRLDLINTLPLVNENGDVVTPFDAMPFEDAYADFKQWLKDANATNMAYMLSAQLAAMVLNVDNEKVDGESFVWSPELGFLTVNDLIALAITALNLDPDTPAGDEPNRTNQEILKDALDDANNNLNFVQTALEASQKDECGDFVFDPMPEPEPTLLITEESTAEPEPKPEKEPKGNNKNKNK